MSEDNHHDGNNDTEERKPLLASPDQEVASLHKSCANHSQKQSWFATSCSVKGFSFVFLLCIFPLLLCWCGSQNAEKEHPLKHIDVCSIAPSLTWSSAHTIAANLYSNLRVGHEITDRLHVIGGLVQVQVNNQVSEPTVRFDLKLTDASQLDLIQIKQITQSDRIAILIDADATAERPLCTVLNILVELPTPTALDELVIETSESSIEIDDGMHFSESIKLGTVNGNITIWDSTGNVMELTTHAGHISCSIQEIPIITQITARSTTGKIVFDYTGDPSSSKALVDQQRKISVNLTTVSGDIDAQMCKVDSLVYDIYIHSRSFTGMGGTREDMDKYMHMLNHTIREGSSLFGSNVHENAVWGSADNATVHLVAKSTAMHIGTNIHFNCCMVNSRRNKKRSLPHHQHKSQQPK